MIGSFKKATPATISTINVSPSEGVLSQQIQNEKWITGTCWNLKPEERSLRKTQGHPARLSLSTLCRPLTREHRASGEPTALPLCPLRAVDSSVPSRQRQEAARLLREQSFPPPTRAAPGCVRWRAPPPQSAPSRGWSSVGLASLLSGRRTWGLPAKHEQDAL